MNPSRQSRNQRRKPAKELSRRETNILPTHTRSLFQAAVRRAAALLRAGEAVVLPTETVYGLAANAFDPKAVSEIYRIKGRPAHNPIIVHVANLDMARACARRWPARADALAEAFWPGPLTLVVPRSKEIPDIVTGGGETVGIRWPNHPFIQAVIRRCGFPLAAPSANLSNRVSPTTAGHVRRQLDGRVGLIADGGPSPVGIESTVLDLTASPARVLRPGMIRESALKAVIGRVSGAECQVSNAGGKGAAEKRCQADRRALRSPGQLRKHYAPQARLILRRWRDDESLRRMIAELRFQISDCCVIAHSCVPSPEDFRRVGVIPREADAFGRVLYHELHQCDEAGASLIVVEAPPKGPEWNAIADRLKRASA